ANRHFHPRVSDGSLFDVDRIARYFHAIATIAHPVARNTQVYARCITAKQKTIMLRHAAPSTKPKNSSSERYSWMPSRLSSVLPRKSDTMNVNAVANRMAATCAIAGQTCGDWAGAEGAGRLLSNPMEWSSTPYSFPSRCRQA